MGARQSKRSVDISATPPKKGAEENGGVATEDGSVKLEKATEHVENIKATLNGDATHTEQETPTVNGTESPAKTEPETPVKAEEATESVTTPLKAESAEVTSPEETPAEDGEKTAEKSEKTKEKKKNKILKSLRSLSFSRKQKPEKTPVTSPTPKEDSEKTEENTSEAVKSEEPSSPLMAVIEETGAVAATKIEETLTEVSKEIVTVCEKVKKEVTEKVEAVVEKVEAVVEKKSEPEKVPEVKTESVPASAPAEEVPPPLPASPPPPETPSPVVVATETIKNVVNDHQQQDAEGFVSSGYNGIGHEMNGGGEGLAELTPEEKENPVLVNGGHPVTNGTNGIGPMDVGVDEEIKPPTSDKVEEDLSSKMESLKMQVSEDLPEIIDQTNELVAANE